MEVFVKGNADHRGAVRGRCRPTYRASISGLAAAASTACFFLIEGSSSKVIRIQRVRLSGATLTAVAYASIQLRKFSTASSGGTSTSPTKVPLDSADAASTANVLKAFTVAPTDGSLVGTIGAQRLIMQATTAAAAGIPTAVEWDFRDGGGADEPTLRGTAQGIGLGFAGAPASAVTLDVEIEYTEE